MEYQNVIRDFAQRTRENLRYIEDAQAAGAEVYEVTQLVNSLLGLLVFPQQYFKQIPKTPMDDLLQAGWPRIEVSGEYPTAENLRDLMRYLRNAIAHFNIEFIADHTYQLDGIRVWNVDTRNPKRPRTWEARISFADLRIIVDKFTALILEEAEPPSG